MDYPPTPGFERVPCRAPAFGLRQLAGAFARGPVESGAAWLVLRGQKRRQVAAVQTLSRLRNRLPHACASCSLQAKHTHWFFHKPLPNQRQIEIQSGQDLLEGGEFKGGSPAPSPGHSKPLRGA